MHSCYSLEIVKFTPDTFIRVCDRCPIWEIRGLLSQIFWVCSSSYRTASEGVDPQHKGSGPFSWDWQPHSSFTFIIWKYATGIFFSIHTEGTSCRFEATRAERTVPEIIRTIFFVCPGDKTSLDQHDRLDWKVMIFVVTLTKNVLMFESSKVYNVLSTKI